jgi:RNA polymerase sigma-70 factor (ECF subfamily)
MATYGNMPPSADRSVDAADDEGRLIDRSRQGDAAAFTQLVSAHQGRVRAYIGGTINRPEVVDDLAQEVFLSAFRSLETYKGEAPFGVWLLGIARHKTLMHSAPRGAPAGPRVALRWNLVLSDLRVKVLEADEMMMAHREREVPGAAALPRAAARERRRADRRSVLPGPEHRGDGQGLGQARGGRCG